MNKQETTQVIALMAGNYNNISEKTKEQKQLMISTWYECLGDLDYQLVLQSVKKAIMESPYPPTIHDIRKNAVETLNPIEKDPMKDWNECYNMIRNGGYMTEEEFNSHSEVCRRFFGGLSQLRAYAKNTEFNMDVTRSNFLKQHDIFYSRKQQENMLPQTMKDTLKRISEHSFIKQIEGGVESGNQ